MPSTMTGARLRVASYDGYKASRPEEPEDLTPQFEMLQEILRALGMPTAWATGWEAEDAIGSLTARRPGRPVRHRDR